MKSRWEQRGIPNPGSRAALDAGCLCPILDNDHGRGIPFDGELTFWQVLGCPVHAAVEDTVPL